MTEDQIAELFGQLSATQELMVACLVDANAWDAEELNRMKNSALKNMRFQAVAAEGPVDPLKIQAAAIRATEALFSKAAAELARIEE